MGNKALPVVENAKGLPWATPAPFFVAPTPLNPTFDFSSLGGHFVVLVFFGSSRLSGIEHVFNRLETLKDKFARNAPVMFGVTAQTSDLQNGTVLKAFPFNRVFADPEWQVASKFRILEEKEGTLTGFCPYWYVIDPMMRTYASGRLAEIGRLIKTVESLPAAADHARVSGETWAPVLLIPRVLPRDFCQKLIGYYKTGNPGPSGFMRSENGRTVGKLDPSFKRRKDIIIEDPVLKSQLLQAVVARIFPEVKKSFQFEATRIERSIVSGYSAEDNGFFKAHRDNTTAGTAHRRFAVTINLNAEDYEGGDLRFPEFGPRLYKAPTGGAVVFSCSLLHEATPVTSGMRYATLPFLYGEEDAKIKEANSGLVDAFKLAPDAPAAPSL